MALLRNIIPHDVNINFMGFRFIAFGVSLVVALVTCIALATKGVNYGIDFEGGYILEVRTPEKPDIPELRQRIQRLDLGDTSIQQFGEENDLLIRIEKSVEEDSSDLAENSQALQMVKEALGEDMDFRRVETIGPKVGSELVHNSLKAVFFAMIAMLLYIVVRFEWQFAACTVAALAHDTVAILALFSVFPFEFNETAIIAILITAGYSLNDTIVIFDRIRENRRRYRKMALQELINKSINETLSRTMLTSSTTLLALTALYIWGGSVISTFSIPIIIGIFVGSFSSICVAAPLLLYLRLDEVPTEKQEVETEQV